MSTQFISRKIDIKELIKMLKKALKAEIMASYDYWQTAQNVYGHERKNIMCKFEWLSKEELKHAKMIAQRIKELDAIVDVCWEEKENRKEIECYDSCSVVKFNIENENDAMAIYYNIIEYTENKDHITCALATTLMQEEAKHLEYLNGFVKDLQYIKSN